MQLLDLKYGAFGLDINDQSIKIAKLEKKHGNFFVASYSQQNLEPGIVESGIIKNEKTLITAIKNVCRNVKGKKLKAKHVVISLPEDESFLQVIQMPKMNREETKSAVIFEAENYIPIPIKQVYLDFQIIPPIKNDLDHIDVLIAATPKHLVDSYLSCVRAAGFICLAAELESQSIVRALIKNEVSESPIVLVNVRKNNIDFIVFSGHSIRFTCSLPLPKTPQINTPLTEISIPLKTGAENINLDFENLAEQIKKYINFYQEHASHEHIFLESKVKKILLCGEGATIKDLPKFITEKIGVQTEIGNPFINAPLLKTKTPGDNFLPFTTAIGLTLGGINIEKES